MTRYLLDTNVVSELRRVKPHGAVLAWFNSLRVDQILLSAITIGELQTGVELTRKSNPEKAIEIENWLDQIEDSMVGSRAVQLDVFRMSPEQRHRRIGGSTKAKIWRYV